MNCVFVEFQMDTRLFSADLSILMLDYIAARSATISSLCVNNHCLYFKECINLWKIWIHFYLPLLRFRGQCERFLRRF
jgi:hypothetical protein